MNSSQKNRVRLSIEALERRDVPSTLTLSSPRWYNPEAESAATPVVESATGHSDARPFHAEDSGKAVFNPDGTISASATGTATHLGAFTLHDTSSIVGGEGAVIYIEGHADLEAANGVHLYASFTGSVDFATLTATVTFEWTGGTPGRFANATGSTVWHISLNPDLTYSAVADGLINY